MNSTGAVEFLKAGLERTLKKSDLFQFTGSDTIYRHPLARKVLYTEGVQYVAEHGGAYWLLEVKTQALRNRVKSLR